MPLKPVRRIVTGHNDEGRAVFLDDGEPPRIVRIGGDNGAVFHELWNTARTPAPIDRASPEPAEDGISLAPPTGGSRIRIVDFPPDAERAENLTSEQIHASFAAMGADDASTFEGEQSRHAFMHRTETIDYGIVLTGEITLILDIGERIVRAGDVVIQRGTNHGWSNHMDEPCRVAFVLIDGTFEDGLG